MKKVLRTSIFLTLGVILTVYAATPASKEYVDQTFGAIEQTLADIQRQVNQINQ